jgi:hypothetical protein
MKDIRQQFAKECENIEQDIKDFTLLLRDTDLPEDYPIPWDEILKPFFAGVTLH